MQYKPKSLESWHQNSRHFTVEQVHQYKPCLLRDELLQNPHTLQFIQIPSTAKFSLAKLKSVPAAQFSRLKRLGIVQLFPSSTKIYAMTLFKVRKCLKKHYLPQILVMIRCYTILKMIDAHYMMNLFCNHSTFPIGHLSSPLIIHHAFI